MDDSALPSQCKLTSFQDSYCRQGVSSLRRQKATADRFKSFPGQHRVWFAIKVSTSKRLEVRDEPDGETD
ncbi:hypothetical protein Y032_0016g3119 [Ancylostoma ceylanicum]|nr:hypothetical protein Y032_0016g3119 [Ancylostoma ceylanicum]